MYLYSFIELIQGFFNGETGNTKTVAAEMLQLNLDLISIQAHIALTLLLYAADNRDSFDDVAFDSYLNIYMTDVENFIAEHFDDDNEHEGRSIPYIFEHR